MKFLNDILKKDPDYAGLLGDVEKNRLPVVCTGLSLIHKAAVAAALNSHAGRKLTVICHDEASANELAGDLTALGANAVNLPSRDYCIGPLSGYSKEYEHKRTDTLSKLLGGDFGVLTLSLDAAVQYTVPPEILKNASFELAAGDSIDIKELSGRLISAGYTRSELCEGEGQFSSRGGIFDIYPVNSPRPCRIEFWGEGILFYDYKRLDMGITRNYQDSNHPSVWQFNTPHRSPQWNIVISSVGEMQSNSGITQATNNPDPSGVLVVEN